MGGATGIALATELAPLITGFLMAGRCGSAMTAEISTMVVTEQVTALESMGVDPIHYLVVPRFLACLIMVPLLCVVFNLVGMVGAYMTGVMIYEVDQGVFWDKVVELVEMEDVYFGLRKSLGFAAILGAIACLFGLRAGGGAKGVGRATTNSVVVSLILILFTDFVYSYVQYRWLK